MPSADRPAFHATQYAFTAHVRDPQKAARPSDVEDRRMAIYRDLFYNNIEGFIASGFPVLRAITPDAAWHRRVRRFFAEHRSRSPYFAQISAEFVTWLQTERGDHPDDPAFIQELAHYEWVEAALMVSDADNELEVIDHNGILTHGVPAVSPLAWHLAYAYPVHHISVSFQPATAPEQPTYLIVYRDRLDEIHFLEINAVTYRLLDLLKENPAWTGQQALSTIADELQHADPASVIAHGRALLERLRQRNIIVGTKV